MTGLGYHAEDFPDVQRMPTPDNFSYIIPVEDDPIHTAEQPFCPDPTCECHEDQDEIGLVAQYVERGLLTSDEATDYVGGKHV
jgi:hypothetical protein